MCRRVEAFAPEPPPPALPGAKPAPYPGFIAACDPTLRERAPEGTDWLHEIKIDGYRAQLVGLSYGMSVLTSSSKLAERLLEGTPKILVRHGRRRADEMKRQHITLAELTEALRHQGCATLRSEQRSWKTTARSLSLGASTPVCGVAERPPDMRARRRTNQRPATCSHRSTSLLSTCRYRLPSFKYSLFCHK